MHFTNWISWNSLSKFVQRLEAIPLNRELKMLLNVFVKSFPINSINYNSVSRPFKLMHHFKPALSIWKQNLNCWRFIIAVFKSMNPLTQGHLTNKSGSFYRLQSLSAVQFCAIMCD